jgi:potassium channel subfamily K
MGKTMRTDISPTQTAIQTRGEATQTEAGQGEVEEGTQTIEQTPEEQQQEEEELALSIRLTREIPRVAKDASQMPPVRYTWDEWLNWLKMFDEARETLGVVTPALARRIPPIRRLAELGHEQNFEWARDQGNGEDAGAAGDHPEEHVSPREAEADTASAVEAWQWTWLDDQGPLFSPETETQWLLNKLCMLLEKVAEKEMEAVTATRSSRV